MEFGVFIQNYVPKWRQAADPDAEHHALFEDLAVVEAADRYGFKYAWATEHHFLDEYSHLSANDVVLAYLAAKTDRIHLGSGIFNPLPSVNHPAKVAERVAMLDHVTGGRFEFGTGRGAGSHEILGFLPGMGDLNGTKEIWEEVIGEFPKMWMQETYEGFEGKFWSLPARKISSQALRQAAPGDVVCRRQPRQLRNGGSDRPRRARLLGQFRERFGSPCSRPTRRPSRTPSRSVPS